MKKQVMEFNRFIAAKGLKNTRQREAVAEVFFSTTGHISAEDLYLKVARLHKGIGLTTVYRTLKLLTEAKLAKGAGSGSPRASTKKTTAAATTTT